MISEAHWSDKELDETFVVVQFCPAVTPSVLPVMLNLSG